MKSLSMNLVITVLILSTCALFLIAGCSDRLVNNSSTNLKIAIDTHESFAKSAAIGLFRVIVTNQATGDTTIHNLVLNGAYLEGVIDSLPANTDLLFTVQALDKLLDVIYEGSVITAISANQTTLIEVPMRPIVPMIKLSPRYFEFTRDSLFFVEAKVFNIDSLYGTNFRLTFEESFIWIDSVALDPQLAADSVRFFHGFVDTSGTYYSITISRTDGFSQLVDANGDVTLARIYFRTTGGEGYFPDGFSAIGMQVVWMTKSIERNIQLSSIYTENCYLEFHGNVPMAPQIY